jgi:hypothetical protein
MAVIPSSLNEKRSLAMFIMPFKYRDKRNAYFKEYMRKGRAGKRNQATEEEGSSVHSDSELEQRKEQLKNSVKVLTYDILAA